MPTWTEELNPSPYIAVIVPVVVTLKVCADAEPARVREAQAIRSQQATLADDRRETTGERRQKEAFHGVVSFQRAGNDVGLA